MVYIQAWDEFHLRARQLFVANPRKTRYTIKYTHEPASVILKVTDDIVCLKYQTDDYAQLTKVEELSNVMMRLMTSANPEAEPHHHEDDMTAYEREQKMESEKPKSKKKGKK